MADKSAEKAQQTVRDATDAASETVGKATDTAREASENAARGYEALDAWPGQRGEHGESKSGDAEGRLGSEQALGIVLE